MVDSTHKMNNIHSKPSAVSTLSGEAMSIDEPDFSGLMALTEASIRRKLSELQYPGPEVSVDPGISVPAVSKSLPGQSLQSNVPRQSLQTNGQGSVKIKQTDKLKKQSETPDSKCTENNPLASGINSEIEQQKGHNIQIEESKTDMLKDQKNSTQEVTVTNNCNTLLSAFDDPELVKIVSMGLNSAKTDSNIKQSVKYCGLSVDLPVENKSPEPEQLECHRQNMDPTAENIRSSPALSSENIRENVGLTVESITGNKKPTLKLSPESVKYCGLNMEVLTQGKPSKSDSSGHETVVRSIAFESEVSNADENKFECVKKAPYDSSPSEGDNVMDSNVAPLKPNTSNDNGEFVYAETSSEITNSKDPDNKNLLEDDCIKYQSKVSATDKSDESKDNVSDETVDSTKMLSDQADQKMIENSDSSEVADGEKLDKDTKIVTDKPDSTEATPVSSQKTEKMSEESDNMRPQEALNITVELEQSHAEVSEGTDSEVQIGQVLPDKEATIVAEQEQASENNLGLVISDVCSASEAAVEEIKESEMKTAEDQHGEAEDIQKSVVFSKEDNCSQSEPKTNPILNSTDTHTEAVMDTANIVTAEPSQESNTSETEPNDDRSKSFFGNLIADDNSNSVDIDIKSLVAKVSANLSSDKTANTNDHVKPNSESLILSLEEKTISSSNSQQSTPDNLLDGLNAIVESPDDITIIDVQSLDSSKSSDQKTAKPSSPAHVSTELSALESMVQRVSQNQQENTCINAQIVSESHDSGTYSSTGMFPERLMNDQVSRSTKLGNELVETTMRTNNENQNQAEREGYNDLNIKKHLVSGENGQNTELHGSESSLNNSAGHIQQGKDCNSSASISPNLKSPDDKKSTDTHVTESNSLSEVGEMLMITNVRTISLDEAEQLNEESENEDDNQSRTSEISGNQEHVLQNDKIPDGTVKNLQSEVYNNSLLKLSANASEILPSSSAESLVKLQNEISKNNIESINRTNLLHVDHSERPSKSPKAAIVRNMFSLAEKAFPKRKYTRDKNSNSQAGSTISEESNSSTMTSAPASSNTGMPIIANTFSVKEEPIDYEPYGIPDNIAGPRAGLASNTQPSFQTYGGPRTTDTVIPKTIQPQASSSDRQLYGFSMSKKNHDQSQKYKHFVNLNQNAQVVGGKVVMSSSLKDYASSSNNATQAPYNRSQTNARNFVQHQKSPVTVIMDPSAKLSGNTLFRKVNVSRAPTGTAKVPKVQAVKRQFTGPPVRPAQSHPSVVHPPAKSTNVPVKKLGMNLKTINIDTVGIPMITEMIARKNPLPVYKPPPPPKAILGNEKTRQTFPCYECGDTFYFTSSLEQHVNRCSMKINYKCEWCIRILQFTNKCQLLSHLRSHMNIDKNQAVPIHIKSDSIEILTNFDDINPGKEFKWFKIPEKENGVTVQESQIVMGGKSFSQVMTFCKQNECTECKLNFYKKDENAKSIHFAPDRSIKPIFCGKCPMYLYNHCGMKAHRRLHEDLSKADLLVCPECGLCSENNMQMIPHFLQHIKTKCFHLSRFSSIKCSKCSSNCSSMDELRHHLIVSVEQYYKCNRCPMALKTLKSFKSHFTQTHKDKDLEKDDTSVKATAKIIYRCHVCDTLIDDKEFLLSHIEKHFAEIKDQAQDFFHCLQCGLIFFEKKSLQYHFVQTHKTYVRENFCTLCRTIRMDQIEYTHHILENHVAQVFKKKAEICDRCGLVCADENSLRVHECHMKNVAFIVQGDSSGPQTDKSKSPRKEIEPKNLPQKQVKAEKVGNFRKILPKPVLLSDDIPQKFKKRCPSCAVHYSTNYKRVNHLRSHVDEGIYICVYCEQMNFEDHADLVRHELGCGSGGSSDLEDSIPKHLSKSCPSCFFVYRGSGSRKYHLRTHRTDNIFICLYCDAMNFNDYSELRSHEVLCNALNKTTVKSPDKSPSRTKIKLKFSKGKTSGKASPKKSELYQLEYKCDECGQLFNRKEKQEEHTRLEHGIHPCHLCGLMYESHTSLKKHLLISHEGKKCVYYCWVCRRRRKFFSDVAHLQKHFTMKHKQKVWDPAKAVPALPGFGSHENKTTQPSKRRLETTPEKTDTPVKKLRIEGDKGFKCAKCNFMSDERKDFQVHIQEHKTDDDSVQCIECGLCFMVLPSLQKHLFMVHKVRDFDAYLKEHGIEDLKEPEDVESESESDDSLEREELMKVDHEFESSEEELGNPLECKVCYKTFETEHLMKSHMRVHGMAFIKKTRRSLSSSAKKPKLDTSEENDKIDKTEAKMDENISETVNHSYHVGASESEK